MRRILTIFLLLTAFLCSCSALDYVELSPDENKTQASFKETGMLYVANTSSRTYHIHSCYITSRIENEDRFETYDEKYLTQRGFTPCRICKPNDVEVIT